MRHVGFRNIVLALIVLTGCRCAFFNTFYNAKVAFNTGRREHVKFLRTRTDTTQKVSATVTEKYDKAITKSGKVLEVYPKKKKWHDDAIFLMGRAAFYKDEYSSAIRRFRRLQREFPQSPFIPDSYLYLGRSYLKNGDFVKAEETFELILQRYPMLNQNEEVTLLMAQLAIQREGKSQAIELLEKTLGSVKTEEKRLEILLKIAELYIDLKQYDNAIVTLKRAPRKKNFPAQLYRIDYSFLICYMAKEMYPKALALADVMLRTRQYVVHYSEVRLKKGIILKKTGELDDAIAELESVTKSAGADNSLKGLAWFELALLYQKELGDFEKAKECYNQAASLLTDKDLKEIARERSASIGELDVLRTAIEEPVVDTADSVDRVNEAHYTLGELFWLKLEEPDSALTHFNTIIDDTTAADSAHTKAIYAYAWISLHMKGDTTSSDSLFTVIIENNPASLYAQRAQREMGLPVTIKTREDSSLQAFLDAEAKYFEDKDAIAATNAYLRVAAAFPDQEIAPQSMFAAAWLCDNVLNKNVTARKLYRMVCDSFPGHDLCMQQARPRLRVVEDTLEAIKMSGRKGRGRSKTEASLGESNDDENDLTADDDEDSNREDSQSSTNDKAVTTDRPLEDEEPTPEPKRRSPPRE